MNRREYFEEFQCCRDNEPLQPSSHRAATNGVAVEGSYIAYKTIWCYTNKKYGVWQ